jgi:ectoine hydroxylase-related dioxygenase (phytanoyl-CoA dioxygenase family)
MAIQDLSRVHKIVSDLFKLPSTMAEWDSYRLTDEQIAFFHENGFLGNVKLLDERQILKIKQELDLVTDTTHPQHHLFYEFHSNESADPEKILFHALGAWRISDAFHDVLWNPRFLMAAYQLLGEKPVRFWHDQLFCKPPRQGGVVAWHQDYSYWTRTKPMEHLTCWCGLDDSTIENGCVNYVPGSHRWGLLNKPVIAGKMDGIFDFLNAEQKKQFNPVPVETKAGHGIFHHPLVLHGSGENKSIHPRRAFVINVIADGVYSDSDEPLLQGVPVIKKGQKVEGQFFPMLFDPYEIA